MKTTPWVMTITALALFGLAACQSARPPSATITEPSATVAMEPVMTQQKLGYGLYEMAYFPSKSSLYIASSQLFNQNGGVIYRVDPTSLKVTATTYTDLKNFGVAFDENSDQFYITNTVDGALTKVDANNGKVLAHLLLSDKNEQGYPVGAREALLHGDKLYVGALADPGFITVVDTKTFKVKQRILNAGKKVTGLHYSSVTDKLYAANASGEILVINPRTDKIEQRWTPRDGNTYLFLNLAEDPSTGRLFVTDNSKARATLVFDIHSGKVIHRIEGDSLAVKFNPKRNEIYLTQRGSKNVLQLDATSYQVKHKWSFNQAPNSLLLSSSGDTLFVTVKEVTKHGESPAAADTLVRIKLN